MNVWSLVNDLEKDEFYENGRTLPNFFLDF